MALITFLSDFGTSDHYVAAVKASILQINPQQVMVDLSHHIEAYNLAHAAYVLRSVFNDFPDGSVHLAAVGRPENAIAVKIKAHYFVGPNNGLFSLIANQAPNELVALDTHQATSFPAKHLYAPAAAQLAMGASLAELGSPLTNFKELLDRQMRASKKQIAGHVIRVDHYGNLITNIEQEAFTILSKNKQYSIVFARENLQKINQQITEVEAGDCFASFNSLGLLQVGILDGNASQLLGMHYDSAITINFEE